MWYLDSPCKSIMPTFKSIRSLSCIILNWTMMIPQSNIKTTISSKISKRSLTLFESYMRNKSPFEVRVYSSGISYSVFFWGSVGTGLLVSRILRTVRAILLTGGKRFTTGDESLLTTDVITDVVDLGCSFPHAIVSYFSINDTPIHGVRSVRRDTENCSW